MHLLRLAFTVLALFLSGGITACSERPRLVFLCGAGIQAPATEIAANFERETGIRVQTHFEGSSTLRDYITSYHAGDLFLSGAKDNLDILAERGLVKESAFMAWHTIAILVPQRLAGRINGLDDLAGEGLRLGMSNPQQASSGQLAMDKIITRHPRGRDILKNIVMYGSTSQNVLELYREHKLDAVIDWDVMAATPEGEGLVVVPIEEPYQARDELHAGLLTTASDPALARKFYDYLTAAGKEIFRRHGYNTEK